MATNSRPIPRKARTFRFLIVGGALALVGLTTFASLIILLGALLHYWLILVLSSFLVYSLNYLVYSRTVFFKGLAWKSYIEYLAGSVLNFILTSITLILAVDVVGLEPIPARVLTALLLAPAAFFFHSNITFRDGSRLPFSNGEKNVSTAGFRLQ